MWKRRLLLMAALAGLLIVPGSASAAALSFDGTRYTFSGSPGESNDLRVFYGTDMFGQYIEFDDSNTILDGGGLGTMCAPGGDSTVVRCDQVLNPLIQLGDELDNFGGDPTAGTPEEVYGGPGNDRLKGWNGNDLLDGGPGDDEFEKGDPVVRGGSDTIVGGDGFDTMNYRGDFGGAGPDPVVVSLDGAANDGAGGENDNVQVEKVSGGEANDLLIGGPGADQLFGDAGADEIRGGGGDDFLDGETGADRVFGDDGNDEVRGGDSSDDFLDGGAGEDKLIADGACFFIGCDPGGEDTIQARDGFKDIVNCGGGIDTATIDGLDVFDDSSGVCETIDRLGGGGGPSGFTLRVAKRISLAKLKSGGLLVTVRCSAPCSIKAVLLLARRAARKLGLAAAKKKAVRVGGGRKSLGAAGTAKVRVKLTPKAKRRLRAGVRLTLKISVKQAGKTAKRTKNVKVTG